MARQLPPAPMYCAHFGDDGECRRADCEDHECHLGDDCQSAAQPRLLAMLGKHKAPPEIAGNQPSASRDATKEPNAE